MTFLSAPITPLDLALACAVAVFAVILTFELCRQRALRKRGLLALTDAGIDPARAAAFVAYSFGGRAP